MFLFVDVDAADHAARSVLHVGAHVSLIKLSNAAKSWSDNDRVAAQDFQKPRNDS